MARQFDATSAHGAVALALILLVASGCDDDAGTVTAGACGGATCAATEVCVANSCRAIPGDSGVDVGPGQDATEADGVDLDTGAPDVAPDLPVADVEQDDGSVTDDVADDSGGCSGCAMLEADPVEVRMSVGTVGQSAERRILLVSSGEASLRVLDIDVVSEVSGFQVLDSPVDQVLLPGDVVEFGVRYTASFVGAVDGTIRVFTDIPSLLSIPVSVTAKAGSAPCLELNPTALNFGSVPRGHPRTLSAQVTNCGDADLTVTDLTRGSSFGVPTPASFQWTLSAGLPASIVPGASETVEVTFTPGRAGPQFGYISVRSNDPDQSEARLSLNALAQAPPLEEVDLHIQLEWDSNNTDVDLHFLREGDPIFDCPLDCFYANPEPDWGVAGDFDDDCFLDTDDVNGYGPENINVAHPQAGTYRIFLHYYDDTFEQSSSNSSNATVRVLFNGVLAAEYGPEYLDSTGRVWDVALLEWPSRTLTPLGQLSTTSHRSCR
jgi:hypothetical protein